MKKFKIVFCAYRDWALEVYEKIKEHPKIEEIILLKSQEEFEEYFNTGKPAIDIVLLVGWSWMIAPAITHNYLCLGVHPSDLPNYMGGSPIQNQIIGGVVETKISLFTISEKIDAGEIWMKTVLSLEGDNLVEIFKNIITSSVNLLNNFFELFPDITPVHQDLSQGKYYRRRRKEESRLLPSDFDQKSLLELYNVIRCLTDPYPNAYMEDKEGNRLLFTGVKYIFNKKNSGI